MIIFNDFEPIFTMRSLGIRALLKCENMWWRSAVTSRYDDVKSYSTAVGGNLGALEGTQDTASSVVSILARTECSTLYSAFNILDTAITGWNVGVVHTSTAWDINNS